MNVRSQRSLAFGLVLLAAAFGFGGTLAAAQEIEPSAAVAAVEADGNGNVASRPDDLSCLLLVSGDDTCAPEPALVASEPSAPPAVQEISTAVSELAPSAPAAPAAPESTESSSVWVDAVKVEIAETVTVAAPGEEIESADVDTTGALRPADAAAGEPTNVSEPVTPTRPGAD
jgi:hypothetical protein